MHAHLARAAEAVINAAAPTPADAADAFAACVDVLGGGGGGGGDGPLVAVRNYVVKALAAAFGRRGALEFAKRFLGTRGGGPSCRRSRRAGLC